MAKFASLDKVSTLQIKNIDITSHDILRFASVFCLKFIAAN
jgi:hypothetical protein